MRSGLFLTETKIEGSSLRFCVFRPVFFGVEALPGRPVKRQILVSWPMSHALSVPLRFYCRLRDQPALVALLQQADCQPAHDLGRLNHRPTPARCFGAEPSLSLRAGCQVRRFGTANYPYPV